MPSRWSARPMPRYRSISCSVRLPATAAPLRLQRPRRERSASGKATAKEETRTKAELAYEAHYKRAREAQMIKEMASKSHKDKVREFNEKLSKLSEHHDIPKVGPG